MKAMEKLIGNFAILLPKEIAMSSALDRLKNLTNKISGYEVARKENLKILEELFVELSIDKKVETFGELFEFKAINLLALHSHLRLWVKSKRENISKSLLFLMIKRH